MNKYKGLECILLVDDNESTIFLHELIIKEAKIDTSILVAKNGAVALKILTNQDNHSSENKHTHPGIILLDINMPKMNGWEFLDEFKKLPKKQKDKIIILMVTSSINDDDRKLAESISDITDFTCKPLEVSYLQNIIEANFEISK